MRWLVTGAGGMLGRDLVELLRRGGAEVTAAGHAELDIADGDAADAAVRGHDVVVNCAAWTAVEHVVGGDLDHPGAVGVCRPAEPGGTDGVDLEGGGLVRLGVVDGGPGGAVHH